MRFAFILSLLLSVLVAGFALLNTAEVTVNFGLFEATGPIALVVILAFVLGVAVGALAMVPGRLKRRREVKTLRKRLSQPAGTEAEPSMESDAVSMPPPPPYTAPPP
ncbi:LapA family protein [Rhodocaloribacter sp.]